MQIDAVYFGEAEKFADFVQAAGGDFRDILPGISMYIRDVKPCRLSFATTVKSR